MARLTLGSGGGGGGGSSGGGGGAMASGNTMASRAWRCAMCVNVGNVRLLQVRGKRAAGAHGGGLCLVFSCFVVAVDPTYVRPRRGWLTSAIIRRFHRRSALASVVVVVLVIALHSSSCHAQGDLDKARSCFDKALALDPASEPALRGLVYLLMRRGDTRGAVEILKTRLWHPELATSVV